MNERMRRAFEQAFAEFEEMSDTDLTAVLEDKAYDGLYQNIAEMTLPVDSAHKSQTSNDSIYKLRSCVFK